MNETDKTAEQIAKKCLAATHSPVLGVNGVDITKEAVKGWVGALYDIATDYPSAPATIAYTVAYNTLQKIKNG